MRPILFSISFNLLDRELLNEILNYEISTPIYWGKFIIKVVPLWYARLEIISDVVSERHVAKKFRYHIGNTDITSVFSDTTEIPMWYRKKPMWYRKKPLWYRIFSATCLSDTTSEIISNRANLY